RQRHLRAGPLHLSGRRAPSIATGTSGSASCHEQRRLISVRPNRVWAGSAVGSGKGTLGHGVVPVMVAKALSQRTWVRVSEADEAPSRLPQQAQPASASEDVALDEAEVRFAHRLR